MEPELIHYMERTANIQEEQTNVLREIRNEINTPELRDRLAMEVLGAFISCGDMRIELAMNIPTPATKELCVISYRWADAMLEARKK